MNIEAQKPKAKQDERVYKSLENFFTEQETINRLKRQLRECGKISANNFSDILSSIDIQNMKGNKNETNKESYQNILVICKGIYQKLNISNKEM